MRFNARGLILDVHSVTLLYSRVKLMYISRMFIVLNRNRYLNHNKYNQLNLKGYWNQLKMLRNTLKSLLLKRKVKLRGGRRKLEINKLTSLR